MQGVVQYPNTEYPSHLSLDSCILNVASVPYEISPLIILYHSGFIFNRAHSFFHRQELGKPAASSMIDSVAGDVSGNPCLIFHQSVDGYVSSKRRADALFKIQIVF